ncbi:MAG: rubredoxin-like domain-containing protein [Salinigranum sp.]
MVGDEGEQPDDVPASEIDRLDLGETVYDDAGRKLGTIRGFDEGGFYVTMREGFESLSVEHARSGHEFGEGYLMWRCTECGEMGDLDDGVPEECPNCGAPREDLYYWTED